MPPQPRDTPNPATTTAPDGSSRKVAGKKPLGWRPFATVGLLVLLALLAFFLIRAFTGSDSSNANAAAVSTVSPSLGAVEPTGPVPSGRQSPAVIPTFPVVPTGGMAGPPSTGGAALSAGGQDVVAQSVSGLPALVGKPAQGSATVQEVVADEGFWVGSSAADRVYVYLLPVARGGGESKAKVQAGDTVSLMGKVAKLDAQPGATAGVAGAEGKAQLQKQGALVLAESFTLNP